MERFILFVLLVVSLAVASPVGKSTASRIQEEEEKEVVIEGIDDDEMNKVVAGLSPKAREILDELILSREEARTNGDQNIIQARWHSIMVQQPKSVLDELFELYKRTLPN